MVRRDHVVSTGLWWDAKGRDSNLINTQTPFQGSKGFDPPTPAEKWVLIFPFHRRGNWGSEGFSWLAQGCASRCWSQVLHPGLLTSNHYVGQSFLLSPPSSTWLYLHPALCLPECPTCLPSPHRSASSVPDVFDPFFIIYLSKCHVFLVSDFPLVNPVNSSMLPFSVDI